MVNDGEAVEYDGRGYHAACFVCTKCTRPFEKGVFMPSDVRLVVVVVGMRPWSWSDRCACTSNAGWLVLPPVLHEGSVTAPSTSFARCLVAHAQLARAPASLCCIHSTTRHHGSIANNHQHYYQCGAIERRPCRGGRAVGRGPRVLDGRAHVHGPDAAARQQPSSTAGSLP